MTLHAEAQRGRLAWPIRNERRIQIAVAALEKFRLEPRESTSDAQVDLLASVYTFRLILIWTNQIVHRIFDVLFGDG